MESSVASSPQKGAIPEKTPEQKLEDFQRLFMSTGASLDEAKEVVAALGKELGMKDVDRFKTYFEHYTVREFFDEMNWKKRAALFCSIQRAVNCLQELSDAQKKMEADLAEEERKPLDPKTTESLNETWVGRYGFPLHPTQECTSQTLNTMYRNLKNRRGSAEVVKGLYTLEDSRHMGDSPRKRRQLTHDFDLVDRQKTDDEDNPHFYPNKSPWLYIVALAAMLRTFCKAGSYYVDDPDTGSQVLNIDRALIEEHLALCQAFVLQWVNRPKPPQDGLIVKQLSRIDKHIRARWWREYRDNPSRPFSWAIRRTEQLADNSWSTDISFLMFPPRSTGNGNTDSPLRKKRGRQGRATSSGGGAQAEPKRKGQRKGEGKGSSGRSGAATAGPRLRSEKCPYKGGMAKCCIQQGDKRFCKFYQKEGGCTKDGCDFEHSCWIMTGPNTVCGKNHAGCNHKGKFVKA